MPGSKAGGDHCPRYAARVPKLIQRFPDGVLGLALFIMRVSSAAIVYPALARLWSSAALAAILILALTSGFGTRAAALILCILLVADLACGRGEPALFFLAQLGHALALALLGPGAYSLDAHRFGRRVIRLAPHSPDRGRRD